MPKTFKLHRDNLEMDFKVRDVYPRYAYPARDSSDTRYCV